MLVAGFDGAHLVEASQVALLGVEAGPYERLRHFKRDVDAGFPYREAIENASVSRFRAVLLTSLTTIAGLTPLMFETSSLAMNIVPIAVTICFGLAFATLLVLFVVPAIIVLAESAKYRLIDLRGSLLQELAVLEVKEEKPS